MHRCNVHLYLIVYPYRSKNNDPSFKMPVSASISWMDAKFKNLKLWSKFRDTKCLYIFFIMKKSYLNSCMIFLYSCNINMIPTHEFNFSSLASFHILVDPQKYKTIIMYVFWNGLFFQVVFLPESFVPSHWMHFRRMSHFKIRFLGL